MRKRVVSAEVQPKRDRYEQNLSTHYNYIVVSQAHSNGYLDSKRDTREVLVEDTT